MKFMSNKMSHFVVLVPFGHAVVRTVVSLLRKKGIVLHVCIQ